MTKGGILGVVGLVTLVGCAYLKPTPAHQKLAEQLLDAVQSGEVTRYPPRSEDSAGDLVKVSDNLANLLFGTKWHLNVFRDEKDIEVPALLSIGKISEYKLISSADVRWRTTPDPTPLDKLGPYDREMAVEDVKAEKEGRPLLFGKIRRVDPREVEDKGTRVFAVDWLVGAKALEYSLETTNSFFKVRFIVDEDSIYQIDVHK